MAEILVDYEKDLVQRAGLTLDDIMFLEPEEFAGEVRHRIEVERCAEIRSLLQLTSLKFLTLPTAKVLYAAGIKTRWQVSDMSADDIVAQVNQNTGKTWADKEQKKMQRILDANEELFEDL